MSSPLLCKQRALYCGFSIIAKKKNELVGFPFAEHFESFMFFLLVISVSVEVEPVCVTDFVARYEINIIYILFLYG